MNKQQTNTSLVDQYIDKADWAVKENANMTYSVQGLNNYIAGNINKQYWLNSIYDENIRKAVADNVINIHDMDQLSAYCVGHDLRTLLMEGFTGVPGKVESKPAKHFKTALGQCCNFLYTLQGETAGAQAFSNFDTYLAPFISYDSLSYDEVRQSMEEFIFNLNVPTRVGFQTPFTNITLDLKCPSFMKDEAVIIGGELTDRTYGEFQAEMDMFNKAYLEVMCKGDAKGRVFSFPIPTYNVTKDFEWDSDISDLIFESAAKYGVPTFSNYINSDIDPEDVRSMCCRLRIDNKQIRRGASQFGSAPLTGSIGVVTINLPRLAYRAHKNMDDFFHGLECAVSIASNSLELKRAFVENMTDKGFYPYSRHYMQDIKLKTGSYWANHFSTIGIIGMAETIAMLTGDGLASTEGTAVAVRILKWLRYKLEQLSSDTGQLYNLEATPAEGTSYKLALRDKKDYPKIITQGGDNYVYYTNSSHFPHSKEMSLLENIRRQDILQQAYTGGTTLPLYIGESVSSNPGAIKDLVRSVCTTTKMPYFSIVPTFSVCKNHGYVAGEHPSCPSCGQRTEIFSKVVGFIRPIDSWNPGKQQEYKDRNYTSLEGLP